MKAPYSLATLVAATLAIAQAGAAEVSQAGLEACRAERDDTRRLACYDREVDRTQKNAPAEAPHTAAPKAAAPTAAAPAAVPPAATPATAEERFGRERALAQEEAERQERESAEIGELTAQVIEIQTRIDGLMTFTLDNGQVWRQNTPDSLFRLKKGDPVKIQPGAMKSFILSGPSKRSTRVTRVK